MLCPSDNAAAVDQSSFWTPGGWNWDAHRIGWTVAGVCTLVTFIISGLIVLAHCRNYTVPRQQRQILRILYMPPIYAFMSFLSYRFFRDYIYYSLIQAVYEAITLSAFLFLLVEFVADSAEKQNRANILAEKEKRRLIFPLCCWRYRPTKEYFMHAVKWSVLQYVFIRPTVTFIGIICQAAGVLCESQAYSARYASVYLDAIDFVSISIALYGLLLFYNLTKEDLRGRRPLAKFLAIKLLVFFTFYQNFLFDVLQVRVIHATRYWTKTNIAHGLNALTICIEMILFSAFMWWAYPVGEYHRRTGTPPTPIGRPLLDSINFSDFLTESKLSVRYFMAQRGTKYREYRRDEPATPTSFDTISDSDLSMDRLKGGPGFVYSQEDIPLPAYPQHQRVNVASGLKEIL
ncbi:hypothetical protein AX17_004441 [Amanita inopinata Kibby_2008]|nr:hypothetical protein AX17_004441 [Amanita inopinata Kibby_2008]